jgi:LiaI-LiaF-like transmembrane region
MRIDRGFFGWGVFFIALGAVPLAVDLGWVQADQVRDLWRLWPLILVGIGVGVLLARSQLALVGTLIISLTFGLAIGGLVSGAGSVPFVGCGSGEQAGGPTSGTLAGSATMDVNWACGGLTVFDQSGSGWQLSASGNAETAVTASDTNVTVRSAGSFRLTALGERQLTVTLPTDPTIALHLKQGFGDGTITLRSAHLSDLEAKVSFGSGHVEARGATLTGLLDLSFDFGSGDVALPLGNYSGTVKSSFGSLTMCAPASLGVRVTASAGFGSSEFGPGFTEVNGAWQSSDYGSAQNRADLTVSTSFGSFNMSRCS